MGSAGLVIIGVGVAVALNGVTASFEKDMGVHQPVRRWVMPLGRLGFIARGLVFGIAGVFLVNAAIDVPSAWAYVRLDACRASRGFSLVRPPISES